MIIGLTGLKGSGKDTVGAYLVKQYGFERRSFADKLKESAAALFDTSPVYFDEWKNDPTAIMKITTNEGLTTQVSMTVRSFLQRYGTEAHRDVFGEDFWIDQVLPVGGYYAGRAIVVTDVRFENEENRIVQLGGQICVVERPGLDLKDPHRSEQLAAKSIWRWVIPNTGTVEDLYREVDTMLEAISDDS